LFPSPQELKALFATSLHSTINNVTEGMLEPQIAKSLSMLFEKGFIAFQENDDESSAKRRSGGGERFVIAEHNDMEYIYSFSYSCS
jgi:hypothetical protein